MSKELWTISDITKLFKLSEKVKSRQTLLNTEDRGEIPKAHRVSRGKIKIRQWTTEQLPKIGEKFGFLKPPKKQKIICVYTAKGGVLKTTVSHSLARMLALNGIKTIIVGLDIQCSITDITINLPEIESLEDYKYPSLGLYHYLFENKELNKIIKNTSLPTLQIIPETSDLNILEKKLRVESRREYLFQDKLIPHLTQYDVVIFDNSPSWNLLIENALNASNIVISPIGCDIGTYQALKTNLNTLFEFQKTMKIKWDYFFLVPTLLEKSKLSQQIYGSYLNHYSEQLIPTPIRRGIVAQEAVLLKQSILEHDSTSPISQDYFDFIQEFWKRITKGD